MTIFIKNDYRILYLLSSVNINLANWIKSKGVYTGKVKVIIPEGEVIGSTTSWAIDVGDIRQFKEIYLTVEGEVQGRGGVNGSEGYNGIYSVYPITIEVTPTGKVRAGGGTGGQGGEGGTGQVSTTIAAWGPEIRIWSDTTWRTPVNGDTQRLLIYWGGRGQIIYNNGGQGVNINATILTIDGIRYKRGTLQWESEGLGCSPNNDTPTPGCTNGWYAISKEITTTSITYGKTGTGGTGGKGQGYEGPQEAGANGTAGTSGAGDGGKGGTGGVWAAKGGTGGTGSNGNTGNGKGGTAGQLPGYAIKTLNGPSTGVIVINNGLIEGRTYF